MAMNLRCWLMLASLVPALAVGSEARAQPVEAGYEVRYQAESPHPYPPGHGKEPAWTTTISHPGATYIAVHFDRFELGPGDQVVVRSPSEKQHRVFTGRGKGDLGAFWATHITGDEAIIEIHSHSPHGGGWGVSIDKYVAGFADLGSESTQSTAGTESLCGIDNSRNAACYAATEPQAYDHSRAVARLLINGSALCTGWLVGCQGHFLTNEHCITVAADAVNTDYEFMAEAPTCGASNCQLCWPGNIWSGNATFIQNDHAFDYALVRLDGNPQATYGSFLLDNRAAIVNERVYIPQHPNGDAKRLALESTDPTDPSGFCEIHSLGLPPCEDRAPGDVGYMCDTQGGSSGSPVVAYSNHQVIALHHCSGCPNMGVPITSVISDLGAALPACATLPQPYPIYESHTIDDSAGNNNGDPEPGETFKVAVTLHNAGSSPATAVIGTLSTTTSGVSIIDNSATWPNIASGASVLSTSPHFTVQVGGGVACGTVVQFNLLVATGQGSFNLSFTRPLGTDVTPPPLVQASTDVPRSIPDNNPTGVTSNLTVVDSFTIAEADVTMNISHPYIGDLEVDLISPANTSVRLHNRSGASADNIVTTFDDLTAPDGPGSMASFVGQNASGLWRLKVADRAPSDVGSIVSWSLKLVRAAQYQCGSPGCVTNAVLTAPASVCAGTIAVLSGSTSTDVGLDCDGTLQHRFEQGVTVVQDWSLDPDVGVSPIATTSYTMRTRDTGPFPGEDSDSKQVTVVPSPTTTVSQSPNPACSELDSITLLAGPLFSEYIWRDDNSIQVGTGQSLVLSQAACGRTYTVQVRDTGTGCTGVVPYTVVCAPCAPPEVSAPGSPDPLRMGVDAAESIEFELLPGTGLAYHLYLAQTKAELLAGNYAYKFCDLEFNLVGIWTPVGPTRVRWTPVDPDLLLRSGYVVVAEDRALGLEGSYGNQSNGTPRPHDVDKSGYLGDIGCP
jgi:subtilisin-like proprotein convertase family protein